MNREEWAAHNKKWTVEEFNDWQKSKAAELEAAQVSRVNYHDRFHDNYDGRLSLFISS